MASCDLDKEINKICNTMVAVDAFGSKLDSESPDSISEGDHESMVMDATRKNSAVLSTGPQPLDNFVHLCLSAVNPDSLVVSARDNPDSLIVSERDIACFSVLDVVKDQVLVPSDNMSSTSLKESQSSSSAPSMSMTVLLHVDITHVCDGLYLSDFMSLNETRLRERNITFVINATKEIPNIEGTGSSVSFLKLFVDDVPSEDIAQHFNTCADKIQDLHLAGGSSLIHCALGISRSVSICLAYLVKHEGRTLRQAYLDLKKKRPKIRPNIGFWRQLITFEKTIRGRSSVKLNVYPMGVIPDVYSSAPCTSSSRQFSYYR